MRGGRQKGARAKAADMAFTGRVDITPTPGVFFGASFYAGGSGHGEIAVDDIPYGIRTSIFDVHAQAQVRGFDIRGLFAQANLADTDRLNQFLGLTGSSGVGETMRGGYVQFGYDVLSQVEAAGVGLSPYIRYEKVDTQAAVLGRLHAQPVAEQHLHDVRRRAQAHPEHRRQGRPHVGQQRRRERRQPVQRQRRLRVLERVAAIMMHGATGLRPRRACSPRPACWR